MCEDVGGRGHGHPCVCTCTVYDPGSIRARILYFILISFSFRPLPSSIMSTSTSQSAASKLIRDIRAAHGFDNKSARDPAVLELRGKLERALER